MIYGVETCNLDVMKHGVDPLGPKLRLSFLGVQKRIFFKKKMPNFKKLGWTGGVERCTARRFQSNACLVTAAFRPLANHTERKHRDLRAFECSPSPSSGHCSVIITRTDRTSSAQAQAAPAGCCALYCHIFKGTQGRPLVHTPQRAAAPALPRPH